MYDNTPAHGVAVAAVSSTPADDSTHAAGTAELRVVYLATTADTSCATTDDDASHQHLALDLDAMESYSKAATLIRE